MYALSNKRNLVSKNCANLRCNDMSAVTDTSTCTKKLEKRRNEEQII